MITSTWIAREAARLVCNMFHWTDYNAVKFAHDPQTDSTLVVIGQCYVSVPMVNPALSVEQARDWLWSSVILPQLLPSGL